MNSGNWRKMIPYAPPDDEGGGGSSSPVPAVGAPEVGAPEVVVPADQVALPPMAERGWGSRLAHGLQSLYFLRFPLLGWIALPLLCAVDRFTGASALTRGIMTMSRTWQAFFAAFFVVALMHTVLICAKNILRNGRYRFAPEEIRTEDLDKRQPGRLERVLNDGSTRTMLWVLAVTHIPSLITLVYLGYTAHQESETGFWLILMGREYWHVWMGFVFGLIAAFLFWYGVSIFYLWVYPHPKEGDRAYRPAAALLLPSSLPGMAEATHAWKPEVAKWAEWALLPLVRLSFHGYACAADCPPWEFHTLSLVALSWFFTLYLFLYPLTAPMVLSRSPITATVVSLLLAAVMLWGAREAKGTHPPEERNPGRAVVLVMRGFVVVALLLFLTVLWWGAVKNSVLMENSFPVLASLLVVGIFLMWFLSGAGFFFDRFRVPVLTALVLMLFLSKFALPWVDQEHYFEARDTKRVETLETPLEVVAARMQRYPEQPLIIVTATGGGIQAAEWTAQVMAEMEKHFRNDPNPNMRRVGYTFHDHLVLASGVSGGSVGLMPYLLEYTTHPDPKTHEPGPIFRTVAAPDRKDVDPADLLTRRLTRAPGCSSLEAVAWGLEYYDLERLLFTVPLLPKVANQIQRNGEPAAPDRTWALSQTFDRNFADRDCGTDPKAQPADESFNLLEPIENGGAETLGRAAQRLAAGRMPAFTFNTTVAETGGRFLLSNYGIRPEPLDVCDGRCPPTVEGTEFLPSESFLQAYARESNCDLPQLTTECYADISLATAARLSATFPVVSSATRIPAKYATRASHFVDGGYYDNDGTGSVTEFLLSALGTNSRCAKEQGNTAVAPSDACLQDAQGDVPRSRRKPMPLLPKDGKLKILLVEIRDSDDMDPTENADDLGHQTGKSLAKYAAQPRAWTTSDQLLAPLEGMWEAGHESITRRNRRELCLLRQAYSDDLEIYHVVLGIPSAPVEGEAGRTKPAPLNWKLTTAQRNYITEWATAKHKPTQEAIGQALTWVKGNLPGGTAPAPQDPCMVSDQTYMRSDMR